MALEEKSPFSDLHALLWKKRKQCHPSHGNPDGGAQAEASSLSFPASSRNQRTTSDRHLHAQTQEETKEEKDE